MMEAAGQDDEIFVYMGGEQRVPGRVKRARIHEDVKIIRAGAFQFRRRLISVEFHDGVEIIEKDAFLGCCSLRSIKLLGVKIIKQYAFWGCHRLTDIEFGNKLETIEYAAFNMCIRLTNVSIPSVRIVGRAVFAGCTDLCDVEFGGELRTLQREAFRECPKLERIALPLKGDMIEDDVFWTCPKLTTVELVGGIEQTVASLHMENWRNEMINEINSINQVLPTSAKEETGAIQQWMERVIRRLDHYKNEHQNLLKEATTLLELALWKANLAYNKEGEEKGLRTVGEMENSRDETRYTSGADIVIKNVLPFLALK